MTTATAPRTVHIIPRGPHWVLVTDHRHGTGTPFADLGAALDAATRSCDPVHVVVHERER